VLCSAPICWPAGRVGVPVALADDHLVLVKVLEHRAPAPKPLASVRADIIAADP